MPEHPTPTIPPIDPSLVAEVKQLLPEARAALDAIESLSRRVGALMGKMDALKEAAGYDDEAIDRLYATTGYAALLQAMYQMAGQASAAADHRADLPVPTWYEQLEKQRSARWAKLGRAGL